MATRKKQARGIADAVQTGVKQMDTEDVVGLVAAFVGSVVFFEFGSISMAGYDLADSTGYALAGADVTFAMILAVGGTLFMLGTNQLRKDGGIQFDTLETYGAGLSLGPTILVWWNQSAMDYVTGDYMIAGVVVLVTCAGYVLIAAAPSMYLRRD